MTIVEHQGILIPSQCYLLNEGLLSISVFFKILLMWTIFKVVFDPKGVPIASYLSGGVSGSTSASDPGLFLITTSALGFRACQI